MMNEVTREGIERLVQKNGYEDRDRDRDRARTRARAGEGNRDGFQGSVTGGGR